MKCENCGVTGKRYGLGEGGIVRDPAFKAKAYAFCETTLAKREKDAKRKAARVQGVPTQPPSTVNG